MKEDRDVSIRTFDLVDNITAVSFMSSAIVCHIFDIRQFDVKNSFETINSKRPISRCFSINDICQI